MRDAGFNMIKHYFKYILATFILLPVQLAPIYSADAGGVPNYSVKEIDGAFAKGNNLNTLNRATALLADLLRVQKEAYSSKHGTAVNSVALSVEETMNDAGMLASQREYVKGMKLLRNVYKQIVDSLDKISKEN